MHPLVKAFGLSLLNVVAYLFLRFSDMYAKLSPGKGQQTIDVSGASFIILGIVGLVLIISTTILAGMLSPPRHLSFRSVFSFGAKRLN